MDGSLPPTVPIEDSDAYDSDAEAMILDEPSGEESDHVVVTRTPPMVRSPARIFERDELLPRDDDDILNILPTARSGSFRLNCKKFFCTFPQSGAITKETAMERILAAFPGNVKWVVVAHENHADGSNHLHCVFWLKKTFQTRSASFFDFITGTHGNYQSCRDIFKVLVYCLKDGDFCFQSSDPAWTPEAAVAARKSKKGVSFEVIAKLAMTGSSALAINILHPAFVLQHGAKLKSYIFNYGSSAAAPALLALPVTLSSDIQRETLSGSPASQQVYTWLLKNMYRPRRFGRNKSLMIIGDTEVGKTSLVRALSKYWDTYMLPMLDTWYDKYTDDVQLVVLDEFKCQKPLTWMNSFVDGSVMSLKQRYGGYTKRAFVPVILLSNMRPEQMYCNIMEANPNMHTAFLRRWEVVRVGHDDNLFPVIDIFDPWDHALDGAL